MYIMIVRLQNLKKVCKGEKIMKEGLSKFLLKKKIFSLIMAVSILFGMLPATASAVGSGVKIESYTESTNHDPEPLDPGEVWVDKEVKYQNLKMEPLM